MRLFRRAAEYLSASTKFGRLATRERATHATYVISREQPRYAAPYLSATYDRAAIFAITGRRGAYMRFKIFATER